MMAKPARNIPRYFRSMRITLTSGRVIDPASQTDTNADVVIEDSVITAIVAPGSSESSHRTR